jgi:hypothetical protein
MIDFNGSVYLGLDARPLPEGSPSRWREKGNDGLEYRFAFYGVSDLSIAGASGLRVTLELDKGAARLYSPERAFSAAFKFEGARIFLRAFSARRKIDPQDCWPPFSL